MHALLTHLVVEIEQMVALGKFALVRGSEDNCWEIAKYPTKGLQVTQGLAPGIGGGAIG